MYKDKKITLDDNKTYLVIEEVDYNGRVFLCLADSLDEENINFVEIKDNNAVYVDNDFFNKEILPLFKEKFEN